MNLTCSDTLTKAFRPIRTRMRAWLSVAVIAVGVAACEAPVQQQVPPQTVLLVAEKVEENFRSQIGKSQGAPLKFKYVRVAREGTRITTGVLFEDDLVRQLAKQDPQTFSDQFQAGFEREMCGPAQVRQMVDSGLTFTNEFLDTNGTVIFSRTLDRC